MYLGVHQQRRDFHGLSPDHDRGKGRPWSKRQLVTATHPVRPEDRFIDTDPSEMPPFVVTNLGRPIVIGAYAWIGAGATIMPGVTIGAGAVVGAGSVVTKDVPDRMIVAGNPARIIRSVDD